MFKLDVESEPEKPENREILVHEPKVLESVENRIYFYSEIDRSSILTLNRELKELSDSSLYQAKVKECDPYNIILHINTYGGGVFAGLAGMDEIIRISKNVDINTIIDGCCASAGTFLSIVGTKRYINKHAYMLIHQLSDGMWGKYEEWKDEMQNLDKLMDMIKGVYQQYTKIPPEKIDEILKHDIWFNAEECLEYGIVDEIL